MSDNIPLHSNCWENVITCFTVFEIWGFYSIVYEDSNNLGCDSLSLGGWFFTFQSTCNAFTVKGEKVLEKCQNQGECILLGPLHPWIWRHYNPLQCWNHTPCSTASHPLVLYSCACWLPESSYSTVLQMEELFVMVTKLPTAVIWRCSKQFVPCRVCVFNICMYV